MNISNIPPSVITAVCIVSVLIAAYFFLLRFRRKKPVYLESDYEPPVSYLTIAQLRAALPEEPDAFLRQQKLERISIGTALRAIYRMELKPALEQAWDHYSP